ncbi:lamin tail domain-containing protein [Candidatus Parcubacteria bacterium]|nr:lamin tail domain-containing protein [Candidatus Parcubacteria bacterium]
MRQSIIKIISLLLIIGLNWTGISAVHSTLAYFSDNEDSNGNIYQAGTLDFCLNSSSLNKFIGLTEKVLLGSVLTNNGSLGFQYTVTAEKISGSDDFCNALKLEAELNGIEKHDDALMSFDIPASTMLGSWSFEIKLPVYAANISHGETCEVDLVFKGWQTDMPVYGTAGFFDEERIHINLTSRMVVLNEFLPNPNGLVPDYGFDFGEDSDSKPQGEWVELYNNSNSNHNLAGWYIWDASNDNSNKVFITDSNTIPGTTTIPANGWLVVYMNKAVFDNTGDTVKLFDGADTLIDSYTYMADNDYCEIEPTPGDENTTNTTGSCGGVPPNKSYARIPDGIGYWVDPIPTPGRMNKLIEEEPIAEEILSTEETPAIEEEAVATEEEPPVVEELPMEEETPSIKEPAPEEPADDEVPVEEIPVKEVPVVEEEKQPVVEEELPVEETVPEQPVIIEEPVPVMEGEDGETIFDEVFDNIENTIKEAIEEVMPIEEELPIEESESEITEGMIEVKPQSIPELEQPVVEPVIEKPVIIDEPVVEEVIEEIIELLVEPVIEPSIEEQPVIIPEDNPSKPIDDLGEETNE